MLYEIISPDAFLRPFIDDYTTLSGIYQVVRNAYTRNVYVDRAFQKKTNELVQKHIGAMIVAHDGTLYATTTYPFTLLKIESVKAVK